MLQTGMYPPLNFTRHLTLVQSMVLKCTIREVRVISVAVVYLPGRWSCSDCRLGGLPASHFVPSRQLAVGQDLDVGTLRGLQT